MKRYISILFLAVGMSTSLFSQIKLGAGLESNLNAVGLKGQVLFGISDAIQIQGSGTLFLGNPISTMLNADVHYVLTTGGDADLILLKAFAGLNYWSSGVELDDSELGINIGLNLTFPINDRLDMYIEPKLSLVSVAQIHIAAGVYF